MALFARLFLIWLSGYLFTSGWINDELRLILTTDPELATMLQAAMSAAASGIWLIWWRIAKRRGWRT